MSVQTSRQNQTTEEKLTEKVIEINRTSKKTKGGNRLSFSALVAVGNQNSRVGVGTGKANSVASAIAKASRQAKKKLIDLPLTQNARTIPHEVRVKFKAARLLLKPAPPGTGVKAGGPLRPLMEVAGVKNVVAKILGSSNKRTNVLAAMQAFRELQPPVSRINAIKSTT